MLFPFGFGNKYHKTIGEKATGYCATFESSAFLNLGYHHYRDLEPGEIVYMTPNKIDVKCNNECMKRN